jgi:hypothetical protein
MTSAWEQVIKVTLVQVMALLLNDLKWTASQETFPLFMELRLQVL